MLHRAPIFLFARGLEIRRKWRLPRKIMLSFTVVNFYFTTIRRKSSCKCSALTFVECLTIVRIVFGACYRNKSSARTFSRPVKYTNVCPSCVHYYVGGRSGTTECTHCEWNMCVRISLSECVHFRLFHYTFIEWYSCIHICIYENHVARKERRSGMIITDVLFSRAKSEFDKSFNAFRIQ